MFMMILTILFLQGDLHSEPINKESNAKENIIVQVKKINKKAKKAEIATKEMLLMLKQLIDQKKIDEKNFMNREIK
jgi:hypothetical protein